MSRTITIDPVTRLEGHAKIAIFLDENGNVAHARLQAPDFRGFEKFCEGRAAEEMPRLTQKICGICPTAHHIASSKALDGLYRISPPSAARKVRELMLHAYIFDDHLLHFYFLGGPDLLLDPRTPRDQRNIFGVVKALGADTGRRIMAVRKRVREAHALISGSPLDPVAGLPGGVAKGLSIEEIREFRETASDAVHFALFSLKLFHDRVLANSEYFGYLSDERFADASYSMGMVDDRGMVSFYGGRVRIVDPLGNLHASFAGEDYQQHLEEVVDPWSYMKIVYLKDSNRKGAGGDANGVFRVGPLARLNAADGMATPLAREEYERMFSELGGKPSHNVMAYHWARLVEMLHAAERMAELVEDEELTSPQLRAFSAASLPEDGAEGTGMCEAPRGTLIHHYRADSRGVITKADLLVATENNAAAMNRSIEKAARGLIRGGETTDGVLNTIEMVFRAYDPCMGCATHCLTETREELVGLYDHRRRRINLKAGGD
jgi:F420-non-reducing hydrogenase large subunit